MQQFSVERKTKGHDLTCEEERLLCMRVLLSVQLVPFSEGLTVRILAMFSL